MLNKSIVNVNMQYADNRHKVVPPILYGGLYSSLNGVFVYDNDKIELCINKKVLRIKLSEITQVKFSLTFRRHSVRSLPTMMVYIDFVVILKDNKSFEVNTLDYQDVLSFYTLLKEDNIVIIDLIIVIPLIESVKDEENGFYDFMQKNGEKIANKYKLDYPSITFDRSANNL